jgi:hypothetical protein
MPNCLLQDCAVSVSAVGIWLSAFLAILPAVASADAGAVRASKRDDKCQLTVFTDPTPLRAGPVDVSVFVQDTDTGQAILDSLIDIEVAPRGRSSEKIRLTATSAAASNKLFQAANFNLPHAGWWAFKVVVRHPTNTVDLHFELEAGDSLPTWRSLWLWFCWPFFVVAVFALIHRGPTQQDVRTFVPLQTEEAGE